ncbi:MAG: HPF/RaiA family ribosome-associated protein, partial [Cyanobacteria bacterium J06598_1]
MRIAPEISYRGIQKTEALETLVAQKISKLEQFYTQISSCRVSIEKVHDHPEHGSPCRVRLDITVPENREIVVDKNPAEGAKSSLEAIIRDAFDTANRQLKELNEQQHTHMKTHIPGQREIVLDKLPNPEIEVPPADVAA